MAVQHQLALQGVTRRFSSGPASVDALGGVSLDFRSGQLCALHGKSGSGKSTLLSVLTGIDQPTTGTVLFNGEPLPFGDESALALWRGRNVGIVFQFFQLIPTLTASENITLPMDFAGLIPRSRREDKARELLAAVGLETLANRFPAQLSGGEQQRVAIARALANDPPILVADEPTGNLDSRTADSVAGLLRLVAGQGKMVIVVTHDETLASSFDRVVRLHDGHVVADYPPRQLVEQSA